MSRTRIALGVLAFALIALLVAPVGMAQQDDPGKEQKRVREMVKDLKLKIDDLIKRLEETHPYYAEKLKEARLKLTEEWYVEKNIRNVLDALKKKDREGALEEGIKIESILKALLDLLEERTDTKELEKKKKEVEEALKKLKRIMGEEEDLRDKTRKLEKEREKEVEQVRKDLERLMEEQKDLHDRTMQGPPRALIQEIEKKIGEIDKLMTEQKELRRGVEEAKTEELQDVDRMAQRLDDLIDRQKRNKAQLEDFHAKHGGVDEALRDLDKLIGDQKKAIEKTQGARDKPSDQARMDAEKAQGDLRERAWNWGNKLYWTPGLPEEEKNKIVGQGGHLDKADRAMESALRSMQDKDLDLARSDQERALKDLVGARDALAKMKEGIDKGKAGELAGIVGDQKQLGAEAGKLAGDMKKEAQKGGGSTASKVMEGASGDTSKASGQMGQASKNMQSGAGQQAGKNQEGALKDLDRARKELEKLQEALARKDVGKFGDLAKRQEDLQKKSEGLSRDLQKMAGSEEGERQGADAQMKMLNAGGHMWLAANRMQNAGGQLSKGQASKGQGSQGQAGQAMQAAKQQLEQLRDDLAKKKKPDFDKLAEEQKRLQDELKKKVARWLEQKAKEHEKKDAKRAQGFQEAQKHASEGCQQMGKAQQSLGEQKPQQGGKQQKGAMKAMEKATEKLDELAKRPLTDEEKEKARQLAQKQKKNKELTDELEKNVEKMGNDPAKRSLGRAGQSMQGAQKSLQQSQPQRAFELEEESLEDLKRAQQELQEQLEELKRQAEQERMVLIEQEVKKVIELQNGINTKTKALHDIKVVKGVLTRKEGYRANVLAESQGSLKATLEEILRKLEEEGVEIFSFYVRSAMDDMGLSADALAGHRLEEQTLEIQADIVRKLTELVEAFNLKLRAEMKPGGG
ncbi:MAG: hypothetical protein ACYTAF_00045 [Planctomycetota bacterium]|jgi:hypothetical protein